jgi:hypothetical protein
MISSASPPANRSDRRQRELAAVRSLGAARRPADDVDPHWRFSVQEGGLSVLADAVYVRDNEVILVEIKQGDESSLRRWQALFAAESYVTNFLGPQSAPGPKNEIYIGGLTFSTSVLMESNVIAASPDPMLLSGAYEVAHGVSAWTALSQYSVQTRDAPEQMIGVEFSLAAVPPVLTIGAPRLPESAIGVDVPSDHLVLPPSVRATTWREAIRDALDRDLMDVRYTELPEGIDFLVVHAPESKREAVRKFLDALRNANDTPTFDVQIVDPERAREEEWQHFQSIVSG